MGSKLSRASSRRSNSSKRSRSRSSSKQQEPEEVELDLPVFPDSVSTEEEVNATYRRVRVLGTGAFAEVWEVQDPSDTRLAMKIIQIESLRQEQSRLPNLRREVDLHRRCDHPNVLKLVNVMETDQAVYIFMELVSGGELFRLIELNQWRGWQSDEHPKHIMKQILEAVRYLHEDQRLFHGDIKPENILCTVAPTGADGTEPAGNELKLADFGFVQELPPDADPADQILESSCGTMDYCAPEVLQKQPYGLAADMWSCGVILHLLCCGELPVNVKDKQDLQRLLRGNFPMEGDTWTAVSNEAKDLVRKLTVLAPTRRFTASQALQHPWFAAGT